MSYSPNFRGPLAKAPAESVQSVAYNNTGGPLNTLTPVYADASGELSAVDVSVEAEVFSVIGLVAETISNASWGPFITHGTIQNITTSNNFGDVLYISKAGDLTNTKPSIGVDGFVAGDWVVRIGAIKKNETNPTYKDLVLHISVIGQL